jgi:hypothetical protein
LSFSESRKMEEVLLFGILFSCILRSRDLKTPWIETNVKFGPVSLSKIENTLLGRQTPSQRDSA